MTEIHVPYTEFDPEDLAKDLFRIASQSSTQQLLIDRHMQSTIERYGKGKDNAVEKVKKRQKDHENGSGHYARLNYQGDVIGSSSINPKFPLVKQKFPFPAALTRRMPALAVRYPYPHLIFMPSSVINM
ncbi:MAG: hypothetical protein M3Q14_03200 [bacterium]|nr:hypothetical protein [bacterium]